MSSFEDQNPECPLCMEPLELDDINFFPCTCGYQICRFCWHRIRTDENGLCPACRKQYPEDPADFKPLTQEELQKIKNEKKQKDLQRKQKISENRKHLANLRVVQKNLVFVVGLPPRLAEAEVLKKHDYFGKFGKIHKVVVNHSTSYAGSQGPSASAYVTYYRAEDALRAIQAVNNIHVDGRTLKVSLGTTKYCSHFLKNQQCPKADCMYLHELGDEAASFTKEEMQQGKHQEYERILHEQVLGSCSHLSRRLASSPTNNTSHGQTGHKEGWSTLQHKTDHRTNGLTKGAVLSPQGGGQKSLGGGRQSSKKHDSGEEGRKGKGRERSLEESLSRGSSSHSNSSSRESLHTFRSQATPPVPSFPQQSWSREPDSNPGTNEETLEPSDCKAESSTLQAYCNIIENQSPPMCETPKLDSLQNEPTSALSTYKELDDSEEDWLNHPDLAFHSESIPVNSSTDWQAAFGFSPSNHKLHDDELGFDPWDESAKGLADLLEKEAIQKPEQPPELINPRLASVQHSYSHLMNAKGYPNHLLLNHNQELPTRVAPPPPGFGPNHINKLVNIPIPAFSSETSSNKMTSLMNMPPNHHIMNGYNSFQEQVPLPLQGLNNHIKHLPVHSMQSLRPKIGNALNMKDWQESLRSMFPNINISFGPPTTQGLPPPNAPPNPKVHHMWNPYGPSWVTQDPAILSSGSIADCRSDSPPHWTKSLHQLTTEGGTMNNYNHHMPFPMPFAYRATQWQGIPQSPPPGFSPPFQPSLKSTEPQTLAEHL
ncbi:CCR4-NOT transcription complex subunit 4-like isoform X2 [Limulus polyphemus]|nr:CCR4-NOT transcription complex subunit 4-like isoform X2 [Limulus polyphemus]